MGRRSFPIALSIALSAGSFASPSFAEDFTETFTLSAKTLSLANLIGEVSIEGSAGSSFEVVVHVQGEDATRDAFDFKVEEGEKATLVVRFPIDEIDEFVYPRMHSNSKSTFTPYREDGTDDFWSMLWDGVKGKQITVRGSGKGAEMWADVTVRVPRGASLRLKNAVGTAEARDLTAGLDLDLSSGNCTVENLEGDLSVDTGSGNVEVTDVEGDVLVDTGSGSVDLRGVNGEVAVDTGSGGVSIAGVRGKDISIDTGSGTVLVSDVACKSLSVDTGSGGVEATLAEASDVSIDTGSGSVILELTAMGKGGIDIDTGSGSIDLSLPSDASVDVDASTGSGSVTVIVDGETITKKKKSELSFQIGEGGNPVTLETGSGSIRVVS